MLNHSLSFRPAKIQDLNKVFELLQNLLEYEALILPSFGDSSSADIDILKELIFEEKSIECIVAEVDGVIAGIAIYHYYRLAACGGRYVLYLEDLYVDKNYRKTGLGYALMNRLCEIANEKNCIKIEWKCITENKSAILFYNRINAVNDENMMTFTLQQENFLNKN